MISDRVIYTDGHKVIVTETEIRVKNTLYRLKGITRYKLSTIEPERIPGLILLTLGFLFVVLGIFSVIPASMVHGLQLWNMNVSVNAMMLTAGAMFLILGLVISIVAKKKYAVRIATALGEHDVVVSNEKEYISKIVEALDEATTENREISL